MRACRNVFFHIAIAVVLTLPMSSCSEPMDELIREEKVISTDERWDRNVEVQSQVKVQKGATLTIAEGVAVTFSENAGLVVGQDGEATIKIEGTARRPVRISGGKGVQLLNASSSSIIRHCTIFDARNHEDNALTVNVLRFPIEDLKVMAGGGVAIKSQLLGGEIKGLTINSETPIALSVPADYRGFIENCQLGKGNIIHLISGGNSQSINLDGVYTYLVTSNLEIDGRLVISSANLKFKADAGLTVGNRLGSTTVEFDNSEFSAYEDGERWAGIVFGYNVAEGSRMKNCKVSGAKIGIMLMSESTFTVSGCDFSNNDIPVNLVRGSAWKPSTIADNNTIPGGSGSIKLTSSRPSGLPIERLVE